MCSLDVAVPAEVLIALTGPKAVFTQVVLREVLQDLPHL